MKFLNSFILRNKMSSIQAQINRLRTNESHLTNERNQARQESQQMRNQWENTDRPRLLNMLFTPENQDSVRNATLTQILDKFQNEVFNPNQGGTGQGTETDQGSGTGMHGVPPKHEAPIPLIDLQNDILDRGIENPNEMLNRPLSEIYKDFKTLISTTRGSWEIHDGN